MALVRKISPVGIDVVIDKVQSYIYNNLVIEHQSYPRVYKNDTNNVGVIPEVYVNENEYSEVFFDDAYTVSSFWLVDDNTSYDEKATTTISVIFQVLLDEAYPLITHRADEEFINDISNILYDNPYNYEITNIVRGIDNVYSEFNRDQVKWDDISNFFVVRFDLEVTYDYNCETNIVGNNCAQAVVKNSDESFVQSINSGATYVLPDIDITLNSNGFLTIPSVQDQDIILVDQDDVVIVPTSVVGNKITVTTSGGGGSVCNLNPIKTGQTTSYATNDDGDLEYGRGVDFVTLDDNNPFGNTNRFTDELGGQTYTNKIYIDWQTKDEVNNLVIGYCTAFEQGLGTKTWANWMSGQPYTTAGFGNWYVANFRQALNVVDFGSIGLLGYAPFNAPIVNAATLCLTSTTRADNNTLVYTLNTNNNVTVASKSITVAGALLIRYFTYAELGL